jgi:hypothetical protein
MKKLLSALIPALIVTAPLAAVSPAKAELANSTFCQEFRVNPSVAYGSVENYPGFDEIALARSVCNSSVGAIYIYEKQRADGGRDLALAVRGEIYTCGQSTACERKLEALQNEEQQKANREREIRNRPLSPAFLAQIEADRTARSFCFSNKRPRYMNAIQCMDSLGF